MKWYLSIVLITLLSVVGLIVLMANFDPFTSDRFVKILFFMTLFVAIWGLGTLIFLPFTSLKQHTDLYVPLRRGMFLSLALVGFAVLSRMGKLNSVTVVIVIFAEVATEFYIHRKMRYNNGTEIRS